MQSLRVCIYRIDCPSYTSLNLALAIVAGLLLQTGSVVAQTLNDPTVTSGDNFGFSVAIDGDHVLIGDRRDDTAGTNVGQAHLFETEVGHLVRTFNDPTATFQDNFGTAVDLDGDRALIGAAQDSTQGILVGQAYLLDAGTGGLLHTFDDPSVTTSDFFGSAVAMSGDNVLVGARGDDSNGAGVGQVHQFDATSGNFIRTFDDPTVTGFDSFGESIAIDGQLVLIGAPGDDVNGFNVGQAHLFNAGNGQLLRTFNDPTITESDSFGASVAIFGNRVLIGAPGDDSHGSNVGQAYLFDAFAGNLLETFDDPSPSETGAFGAAVAIYGSNIVIGAPNSVVGDVASGQAFRFSADGGALLETYDKKNGDDEDEFGLAVSAGADGVVVGNPFDDTFGTNTGQATVFPLDGVMVGDVNLDGSVDLLDIDPFVAVLTSGRFQAEADVNMDGEVNLFDISVFIDLLTGG